MNLFNAKLSPAQVQALYTQISQGTKLRLVSMGHVDNRQDLSHSCDNGLFIRSSFQWCAPSHHRCRPQQAQHCQALQLQHHNKPAGGHPEVCFDETHKKA